MGSQGWSLPSSGHRFSSVAASGEAARRLSLDKVPLAALFDSDLGT